MGPAVLDSATSAGAFPYGPPAEATVRFCPWCYRDGDHPCSVQAHSRLDSWGGVISDGP